MSDLDLGDLRADLAEFAKPKKKVTRTAREERIIAGFEDVQRFVEEHGSPPQHGEGRDIFERLYAVRLDQIRKSEECQMLLTDLDHQGLLDFGDAEELSEEPDTNELASELRRMVASSDITELKHVRSAADKRAADEVANRDRCEDFDRFEPLFETVRYDLDRDIRTTRPFVKDAGFVKSDMKEGQFFILGGQIAYVAEVGDPFRAQNGEWDARLRVIFDNGTESNMLPRSLQRALYDDKAGRRISDTSAGPLFSDETEQDDQASGTIYVLRSKSDLPFVVENYEVLHKIGVTSGKVERRITNAKNDPTFLLADVEIIATYELFNVNRSKLEGLIHKVLEPARLDIEIKDRFGRPVTPREWFLVPLAVIDEVVDRVKEGTLVNALYDPKSATILIGKDVP